MKVRELKEELMARGASRTGVKGTLQQRLHTLILQEAAERARARAATMAARPQMRRTFSVLGHWQLLLLAFDNLAKYQSRDCF